MEHGNVILWSMVTVSIIFFLWKRKKGETLARAKKKKRSLTPLPCQNFIAANEFCETEELFKKFDFVDPKNLTFFLWRGF